ncbi:hypothetical protein PTKU64_06820 [Paraburkholderia terrae]|uniref:Uncharacterized protein n=1 Tax=Paraburkholderia terrae TaxID=311230 RepID=A0ABM7TDR6_9BURK|nr:hypothetical protein [Paraburkholderia terrae]BCZ77007.1 hypothetical protein PTKU64_06820 [Paraburkholderia terrae]
MQNPSIEEVTAAIEEVRVAMQAETPVLQNGYWEHKAFAPASTDTQDQLFHAVGAALSSWESAESALATLYVVLCDVETGSSYSAISRTFGSIPSSAGRRKIIKAAAEIYFGMHWQSHPIKKGLTDLLAAFTKAAERRDEFAHGQAYSFSINGESPGCFLFASQYIASRNLPFPLGNPEDPFSYLSSTYRYTAAEILDFARKFIELRDAVWRYIGSIRRILGRPGIALVMDLDAKAAKAAKAGDV